MQARSLLSKGRKRLAGRRAPFGHRTQRARPQRAQVLYQQCSGEHECGNAVESRLLALAHRTLFRGSEKRDWARSVRGATLPRTETPPDPVERELPVLGPGAAGMGGGKIRS